MIYNFDHPEWLASLPKPDLKAANGNIVIYGAGMCGALAYHALKQMGFSFLAYVDSNKLKHGQIYYEHIIISLEELRENYPDALILIASVFHNQINETLPGWVGGVYPSFLIFNNIDLNGFESPWSDEYLCRAIKRLTIKVLRQLDIPMDGFIEALGLSTSDKCTLKCRDCYNRTPYVKDPKDYDLDKMILSVKNIIEAGFYIDHVSVASGEPFLYKPLTALISELVTFPNIGCIYIVTNATLLPSKDLIKVLRNEKVIVRISDYGELSSKFDELIALFKKEQINYNIDKRIEFFRYIDWKTQNETPKQIQSRFINCTCNSRSGILFTSEGKAYLCISANYLNLREWIKIPENEYVDLLDVSTSLRLRIDALLKRKAYHTACKNCFMNNSFDNVDRVPVAEQLP